MVTSSAALEQARALCTLAAHDKDCLWCRKIAATLMRAYTRAYEAGARAVVVAQRAEADRLERGE